MVTWNQLERVATLGWLNIAVSIRRELWEYISPPHSFFPSISSRDSLLDKLNGVTQWYLLMLLGHRAEWWRVDHGSGLCPHSVTSLYILNRTSFTPLNWNCSSKVCRSVIANSEHLWGLSAAFNTTHHFLFLTLLLSYLLSYHFLLLKWLILRTPGMLQFLFFWYRLMFLSVTYLSSAVVFTTTYMLVVLKTTYFILHPL